MKKIEKVVVVTKSPNEVRAVEKALQKLCVDEVMVVGCETESESGVPVQLQDGLMMIQSAASRAKHARQLHPGADIYVGIEKRLEKVVDCQYDFICVVALDGDGDTRHESLGTYLYIPNFSIPWRVVKRIMAQSNVLGKIIQELADDERNPIKRLSEEAASRLESLVLIVERALEPIVFPERYAEQ